MNQLDELLELPESEKASRGVRFTPREIAQQPKMWSQTLEIVRSMRNELARFLSSAGVVPGGRTNVVLLGAGTSEYVGNSVADTLRTRLAVPVVSIPTTTFVTHAKDLLVEGRTYLFISFARSGDSPESLGTYDQAKTLVPGAHHLVITCNNRGRLALSANRDERALVVELPSETNDQSLVMTSSFSSMVFAALLVGYLDSLDTMRRDLEQAAAAVGRLLGENLSRIHEFATIPSARLQYLGTAGQFGAMQESRLKVVEMTAGRIIANADTFLGLRHGPQVFVDDDCLVVASFSGDEYRRRYEMDLVRELGTKKQGKALLAICGSYLPEVASSTPFALDLSAGTAEIPHVLRPLTDVVVGQLIGFFRCMQLGLKPDNPSESGIISRVVTGVTIYPLPVRSSAGIRH